LVLAYPGDGLFTEVWNAVATVRSWLGWAAGIFAEVAVAATALDVLGRPSEATERPRAQRLVDAPPP